MATLICPEHPSPVADAEALRKACQGKSLSYIDTRIIDIPRRISGYSSMFWLCMECEE